ncbi:hypothetical protein ASC68_18435 [Devosia sp. Root105]|nr:hypothetical protein ASC68_18435 [Devosia sp. Root105]
MQQERSPRRRATDPAIARRKLARVALRIESEMARQAFLLETDGVRDMPAVVDDGGHATICFGLPADAGGSLPAKLLTQRVSVL